MNNFFKSKGKLIALLTVCMVLITGVTIFLAQTQLKFDFLNTTSTKSEEKPVAEPQPEPVVDPPPAEAVEEKVDFNSPDVMRGVVLTPGKDFFTSETDELETINKQIDDALKSAKDYTINTIIVDPRYKDGVVYQTTDSEGLSENDLLELVVNSAKAEGFYIYSVFDLSSYKSSDNENNNLSDGETSARLASNLDEFARKYALDGILLDGYQNEKSEQSYASYAKLGGAMGFEHYMRQNPEITIREAVKTVRESSPSTQVGLLADAVWANSSEQEGGLDTQSGYTSLVSANSDTKGFVEKGLLDFVVVRADATIEDKDIPFEEVANWWGGIGQNNSTPIYIMQSASKVGSGGSWNKNQLTQQAMIVDGIGGIRGNVFDSLSSLQENPQKSTDTLMEYYKKEVEVAIVKPEETETTKPEEKSPETTKPTEKPPVTTPPPVQTPELSSIKLNRKSLTLTEGASGQLTVTTTPAKQAVTWSSSDSAVATVDNSGKITAVKKGSATITAKSEKGDSATCQLTVNAKPNNTPQGINVDDVAISKDAVSVEVKGTYQLDYSVYPDNATDKTVSWKSSSETVVTVSQSGLLTGVSKGTATVILTSADGKAKAECTVTVVDEVGPSANTGDSSALKEATYIDVSGSSKTMYMKTSQTLSVKNQNDKVIPNNLLLWESSDKSVATVDANGVVTAKGKEGFTEIYVRDKDYKVDGYYPITVTKNRVKITKLSLSESSISVPVGKTNSSIKASVEPKDALASDVEWRIVNTTYATVDANGVITGKKAGNTTLIVKSKNSNVQAECKIEVTDGIKVTDISLENDFEMWKGEEALLYVTVEPRGTEIPLIWSSSSPTTVSVDANGNIKANRKGTATITVKVSGKEEYYDTVKITVVE